jgi:hypothetical protein
MKFADISTHNQLLNLSQIYFFMQVKKIFFFFFFLIKLSAEKIFLLLLFSTDLYFNRSPFSLLINAQQSYISGKKINVILILPYKKKKLGKSE